MEMSRVLVDLNNMEESKNQSYHHLSQHDFDLEICFRINTNGTVSWMGLECIVVERMIWAKKGKRLMLKRMEMKMGQGR